MRNSGQRLNRRGSRLPSSSSSKLHISCPDSCHFKHLATIHSSLYTMVNATSNQVQVKEIHPTFGCELSGVDWSKPIPPEVAAEIVKIANKVSVAQPFS